MDLTAKSKKNLLFNFFIYEGWLARNFCIKIAESVKKTKNLKKNLDKIFNIVYNSKYTQFVISSNLKKLK